VRLVAIQWLASLRDGHGRLGQEELFDEGSVPSKSGEGKREKDWKMRAAKDPSTRIQWFAGLED